MLVVHEDRLRPFLLLLSLDERQDDQSHDKAINKIMRSKHDKISLVSSGYSVRLKATQIE